MAAMEDAAMLFFCYEIAFSPHGDSSKKVVLSTWELAALKMN